jgi:hypothetical protein
MQSKYDILKSYKSIARPDLIKMTWANLGGLQATADTRTYVQDMIYESTYQDLLCTPLWCFASLATILLNLLCGQMQA